jgi:hypothetical protein
MSAALTNPVYRYNRRGERTLVTCDQTKRAMAILQVSVNRDAAEKLAALKARQDAGDLTPHERVLRSIFGEIK